MRLALTAQSMDRPIRHKFETPPLEGDVRITRSELAVRYVSLHDSQRARREDWLATVFDEWDEYPFGEDDANCLSIAFSRYDALVVGGNDTRRISRLIRPRQAILSRKLKICLVSDLHPQRRAQLMLAGFDDVFDITRLHPVEAVARVRAMWRRYEMRLGSDHAAQAEALQIDAVAHHALLTPRERSLLLALLSRQGIVPYIVLRGCISNDHEHVTLTNLKVAISHLRKKLRAGVRIVSHARQGYELLLE
ncbi:MAG: hypothetical protein RIS94_700 [Pseudomonadota bacterium]|jgi:DNA-binding response OmpR family regulator